MKRDEMRRAVESAVRGTNATITEKHYKQMKLTGGYTDKRDIIAEAESYRLTVSMSKESIKVTLLVKEGSKDKLSRIASMLEDRGLIVADVDKDRLVAGFTTSNNKRVRDTLRDMNDVLRMVSRRKEK